jgi:23S rRNA pseudouridine1911/1915/1917 synthase
MSVDRNRDMQRTAKTEAEAVYPIAAATAGAVERRLQVSPAMAGRRLDQVLAQMLPEFSRSRLQQWIEQGQVQLDGAACGRRQKVRGGEEVCVHPALEAGGACEAQPIPLDVVFEDAHLIVVSKPANFVVHPAAGNADGTLQNALLHHAPELEALPRAGIVHRLDKDTTGLLVVAKTLAAHKSLVKQLQARSVQREYRALVQGRLVAGGTVDAPIGRHPLERTRMAVVAGGRPAITHYRVLERFTAHSLLALRLETGRTHQIRVHMAHIRYPVVGDPAYGGRVRVPRGTAPDLIDALRCFPRQALHAIALGLRHPKTGAPMRWEISLAPDIAALLALLRQAEAHGMD